jgi:arylsulfatase A-like enzyme
VSDRFRGQSEGGLYGDVIECLDWSTGRVLDCLRELGLDNETYVVFTSDNGPKKGHGSSGPFRDGKHSAYEGGFRVPCVIWAPERIPAGRTSAELASTMDLYPTFAALAGAPLPTDRVIDGKDIGPLLHGEPGAKSPHEAFYYFVRYGRPAGVRVGKWKLLIDVETGPWSHRGTALYDLETDPGETKNLADKDPETVQRLRERLEAFVADLQQNSREPGSI